jgi:hypothetical protein
MKRSLCLAVTLIGWMGLFAAPHARAQGTNPNITPQPGIPTPSPSPVLPINQPVTFRYSDAQGFGSITFTDLGPDPMTNFDLLRVNITQNGLSYNGSGIATPIPGAPRPLTNLVSFTLIGPDGTSYFFEGKMGLGVEFQGTGTYFPVNNPTQTASWGLLFAPGVPGPTPGPTPTSLSLGLDRGCGSFYPLGASMVISYSASANDTLTLINQRNDGTFTIFSNQPVTAGQTYTYSTFVSNVPGPRTLILMDSAGVQSSCTFTGG